MLEVLEITDPVQAGTTTPYLCRLSDESFYYVKGRSLTCNGLVSEYVCAHLGREFGLPIPQFEIVQLPDLSMYPKGGESPRTLGFGPVFASKRLAGLGDLEYCLIPEVPMELRRDVAVFDYWVRNDDRTLTPLGGNPNLFWDIENSQLTVFDHNLAFCEDYNLEMALQCHPFREDLRAVLADQSCKRLYIQKFATILQGWDAIVHCIPDEWLFKDDSMTIEADIDFDHLKSRLNRLCRMENWGS
nr:HipA family kinase [Amylibacter sp.]